MVGVAPVPRSPLLDERAARRAGGRRHPGRQPPRSGSTGPTISGITSPALRRITVSPGRTSLRSTSWKLCSVAFSTVEPATLVGSMTPYGVTRPVRPTLTAISRSLVLTSSGGYLYAIAQRGARLVEPSRRAGGRRRRPSPRRRRSRRGRSSAGSPPRVRRRPDVGEGRQHPHLLGDGQAPGGQRLVGLRLRAGLEALARTDAVTDHAERAGRRDPGILLPQGRPPRCAGWRRRDGPPPSSRR